MGCTELKFLHSFGAGFCGWNTDFDRMNRIWRMIERETPCEGTPPKTKPRQPGSVLGPQHPHIWHIRCLCNFRGRARRFTHSAILVFQGELSPHQARVFFWFCRNHWEIAQFRKMQGTVRYCLPNTHKLKFILKIGRASCRERV